MHGVIETSEFLRQANGAGMSETERFDLVSYVARNPEAGDLIQGTGGVRKVRFARPGKGKSGGYRVVTFYTGPQLPVFLLTVFAKGDRANLTKAERNALAVLTKALSTTYGANALSIRRRR